jgi:hypothetical protein
VNHDSTSIVLGRSTNDAGAHQQTAGSSPEKISNGKLERYRLPSTIVDAQPVDGADQDSQCAGPVMSDDNWIDEIDNVPMALIIDEMMEDHPLTDEEVAPSIGYSAAAIRMFRRGDHQADPRTEWP